jgi:parallel beta-helix repeat protein
MKKRLAVLVAVVLGALSVGAADAAAITYWVNDDATATTPPLGTGCSNPDFNSIEAAVNFAGPGDTILVCPGTYEEIVTVEPGKNNLTIRSVSRWAAIIEAPPTIALDLVNFQSIVRITTSTNVTLRGFVVTGPGPHGCNSIRTGVRVDGNGSANILDNHITRIHDTPFGGCQNGVAIQVGRQADGQTGHALIAYNWIDLYQKNGPTVDNAGSSAVIHDNLIEGIGPNVIIAQNGIQVSRGATASVTNNNVRDHAYIVPANLPEFTATGILLFQAASTTVVDDNDLRRNQDGIGIYTMTNARISNNTIIGDLPSFDPLLGTLTLGDGIYAASDTAGNRIIGNFARENVEHDCHDDSGGPAGPLFLNIWIDNDGLTQNKAGLCRERDDDDDDDDDDHGDGDDESDDDDDSSSDESDHDDDSSYHERNGHNSDD